MRPHRVRYTVRQLMVVVVIAAVVSAGVAGLRRRERFLIIAKYHENLTYPNVIYDYYCAYIIPRRSEWHAQMARKYRHAAAHPWLLVPADPPEHRQESSDRTTGLEFPPLPEEGNPFARTPAPGPPEAAPSDDADLPPLPKGNPFDRAPVPPRDEAAAGHVIK